MLSLMVCNDYLIWGLMYIIYMFKLNVCKYPKNTFRVVALLYILKSVGWSKLNFQKGLQRAPTNPVYKSSNVKKSTLSLPHPSTALSTPHAVASSPIIWFNKLHKQPFKCQISLLSNSHTPPSVLLTPSPASSHTTLYARFN